ncbi:hypothetical protein BKA62DRAFT_234228 [Auriculariales sp. MPI-PUGE-AT-0066]|nr:hypothetical protein BKA62DRAFT_234228 [Auriculariales sp. MPI-PUGE-AT-0066]
MESEQRGGILGTILGRGQRPRSSTHGAQPAPQLNLNLDPHPPPLPSPNGGIGGYRAQSPGVPPLPSPGGIGNISSHRRRGAGPTPVPQPTASSNGSGSAMTQILRRRRSANAVAAAAAQSDAEGPPPARQSTRARPVSVLPPQPPAPASVVAAASRPITGPGNPAPTGNSTARRIRLVPHLENNRSLHFDAITRDVRPGDVPLRIGRFTDRNAGSAVTHSNNKLAFRSKVVSRGHAEIWLEDATFYIRDTKSSSGTFLNHIRLAPPNTESRPFALKDGDILQLGVDYQGGTEEIYRCVKMRIEVGREWQQSANAFNQSALAQLRALSNIPAATPPAAPNGAGTLPTKAEPTKAVVPVAASTGDCCICLFAVTVCQALFIAPCSHAFHYKCIRPLLTMHHPGFSCPLCRTFGDLNADVEIEIELPPAAPTPPMPPADLLRDMTRVENVHPDVPPLSAVEHPPETAVPRDRDVVDLTMDDVEDDTHLLFVAGRSSAVHDDEDPNADVDMLHGGRIARTRSRIGRGDETTDAENELGTSVRSRVGLGGETDAEDSRSASRSRMRGTLDVDRTMLAPSLPSPADGGGTLIGGMSFEALLAAHAAASSAGAGVGAGAGAGSSTNPFHAVMANSSPAAGGSGATAQANGSGSSLGNGNGRDPDEMDVEEIEAGLVQESEDEGVNEDGTHGRGQSKRRRAA